MSIKHFRCVAALLASASLASSASAATSASQAFNVIVPQSLSITAPTTTVSLTHDETDNPNAFPAQTWTVKGNVRNGVNVTFQAATPFIHETDTTFKRNAQLALAVGTTHGPAAWTVDTATDATDYAANDNQATVAASSNGVGRASFGLTVTFVTGEFGEFAAGTYQTTVVGTIAAK